MAPRPAQPRMLPASSALAPRRRLRPARLPRPWAAAALAALSTALPPVAARADAAGACHCFRDRTFEPDRPAAADPYVLATVRSSLLSAAFEVPKADLVRAAMGGAQPEALWLAHAGARWTGRPAGDLLDAAEARGWPAALLGARGLPAGLEGALRRGAPAPALAALVVEEVLVGRVGASPASLAALRDAGATPEELVLGAVLARHTGAPSGPLVREVHAGRSSWGRVLHDAGLEPKGLDAVVRALVRGLGP